MVASLVLASLLAAASPSDAKGSIKVLDFDEGSVAESTRLFDERVKAGDKTILFEIDSHGGQVELGMDFIHHIREVKRTRGINVLCVVNWKAYSMGFFFLQGACDQRLATKDAILMTHEVAAGVQGKADQLANAALAMEAMNDAFADWCSERMGISKADYRKHVDHNDWWMSASHALELHAIDAVVSDADLPAPFAFAPKNDELENLLKQL